MLWAQAHPFSQSGICLLWIKRFSYTSVFLPVPTFMLVTTFVASSIAFCWCRRRDFGALLPEPSTVEMLRDLVIITLHFPFSNASSRCLHKWTKNCVNCNSFAFFRCGFSKVSPWHFYQSTNSHTNCICLAFLQCAILYLSSIVACRVEHKFHFFDFSCWGSQ